MLVDRLAPNLLLSPLIIVSISLIEGKVTHSPLMDLVVGGEGQGGEKVGLDGRVEDMQMERVEEEWLDL